MESFTYQDIVENLLANAEVKIHMSHSSTSVPHIDTEFSHDENDCGE